MNFRIYQSFISNYFKKLIYSGTQYSNDLVQSKKIILCNQIIILLGTITVIESIVYLGLGLFKACLITFFVACLYIGCFRFNAIGQLTISRYIVLVLFNSAIFLYSVLLEQYSGMSYVFFVSMIIPLVIFEKHQFISKLFFVGLPFLSFFLLTIIGFMNIAPLIILGPYQAIFHFMVISAVGLCLIGIFYFYFSMYEDTKIILNQVFKHSCLTQREIEIVSKIMQGLSNKEIGNILYIEESTVKQHMKNIFKKLNVKKRIELMAFALKK